MHGLGDHSHTELGPEALFSHCLSFFSARVLCFLSLLLSPCFFDTFFFMGVSSSEPSCGVEISGGDFGNLGLSHVPAIGLLHPGKEQDSGVNSPAPKTCGWIYKRSNCFQRMESCSQRGGAPIGFMSALEESYG